MNRKITTLFLATFIALNGCTGTRHYLMTPASPDTTPPPTEVAIGVGPVTLAGHLQRKNIVTRTSATRIRIAQDDYWAIPLDTHLLDLLATNLRQRLGIDNTPNFPWPPSTRVDYQITVHITRFIHEGDYVYLDAYWRILDGPSSKVADDSITIGESSGSNYDQIVNAMSRAVGRLADHIADAIRVRL